MALSTHIHHYPNYSDEWVIRDTIIALQENSSTAYGEYRIDALTSMFIYFHGITWFFKKYPKLEKTINQAIFRFLNIDIPAYYTVEFIFEDDTRMRKLHLLQRVIEDLDAIMK